jgi:archaemetzincin
MNKSIFYWLVMTTFFWTGCSSNDTQHAKTVGIQPLGAVKHEYLDSICVSIRKAYGLKAIILPRQKMPERFSVNIKAPRYRADSIIHFYATHKPDSLHTILAVTEYDISITKKDSFGEIKKPVSKYTDWGVFGYGFCPGASSVISTYRLKSSGSETVDRVVKVAMHEAGHNLGLRHCKNTDCVMQDAAEKISTIDRVERALCEQCKKQIR